MIWELVGGSKETAWYISKSAESYGPLLSSLMGRHHFCSLLSNLEVDWLPFVRDVWSDEIFEWQNTYPVCLRTPGAGARVSMWVFNNQLVVVRREILWEQELHLWSGELTIFYQDTELLIVSWRSDCSRYVPNYCKYCKYLIRKGILVIWHYYNKS